MYFGDRQRTVESTPRLLQQHAPSTDALGTHAGRFHIGVGVTPVAAPAIGRVELTVVVEQALTGHVVIDTDHVRRARVIQKPVKLRLTNAPLPELTPHRMVAIDGPTQQIPREPAALVLELG